MPYRTEQSFIAGGHRICCAVVIFPEAVVILYTELPCWVVCIRFGGEVTIVHRQAASNCYQLRSLRGGKPQDGRVTGISRPLRRKYVCFVFLFVAFATRYFLDWVMHYLGTFFFGQPYSLSTIRLGRCRYLPPASCHDPTQSLTIVLQGLVEIMVAKDSEVILGNAHFLLNESSQLGLETFRAP
ncbi:hypothetical protein MCOR02_002226 [Pyricularia oryzae]|uniref:Uncharacterized protein n=1 Tax=Pyricularia oryzae TaxID=318829 RepID=A0A4P7N1L9_PYROR|nr:hypothetical protein MCOR02_002226 [Pyricularia oryzae]QBZ56209.1 hypothetical protein PoMZ_01115 [Pyricularia oryzae]